MKKTLSILLVIAIMIALLPNAFGRVLSVDLATVDGAQIRTTGVQGLRFISTIDKASNAFSEVVEYGTLLVPSDAYEDIRIGGNVGGMDVVKVPAVNVYAEDDETITFTAVITNIKPKNYTRNYLARAYAILVSGEEFYGETYAIRSLYGVAERILENPNASDSERAVAQEIDAVANPTFSLTYFDGTPVEGTVFGPNDLSVTCGNNLEYFYAWYLNGVRQINGPSAFVEQAGDWTVYVYDAPEKMENFEDPIATFHFTLELAPPHEEQIRYFLADENGIPLDSSIEQQTRVTVMSEPMVGALYCIWKWQTTNMSRENTVSANRAGDWTVYVFDNQEAWRRSDTSAAVASIPFTVAGTVQEQLEFWLTYEGTNTRIGERVEYGSQLRLRSTGTGNTQFYYLWLVDGVKIDFNTIALVKQVGTWQVLIYEDYDAYLAEDESKARRRLRFTAFANGPVEPIDPFTLTYENGTAVGDTVKLGATLKFNSIDPSVDENIVWFVNNEPIDNLHNSMTVDRTGEWKLCVYDNLEDWNEQNPYVATKIFTFTVEE